MIPQLEFLKGLVKDYQRPNHFSVLFHHPAPPTVGETLTMANNKPDYASILVRATQIPGVILNTTYALYNNKKNNFATTLELEPATFEIYCDDSNSSHAYFTQWRNMVILPNRIMNWKENYVGTVDIDLHDIFTVAVGKEVVSYKLLNAFPIHISPIDLSHDETDSIAKFTVTMIYDDIQFTYQDGLSSTLLSLAAGFGATAFAGLL